MGGGGGLSGSLVRRQQNKGIRKSPMTRQGQTRKDEKVCHTPRGTVWVERGARFLKISLAKHHWGPVPPRQWASRLGFRGLGTLPAPWRP